MNGMLGMLECARRDSQYGDQIGEMPSRVDLRKQAAESCWVVVRGTVPIRDSKKLPSSFHQRHWMHVKGRVCAFAAVRGFFLDRHVSEE